MLRVRIGKYGILRPRVVKPFPLSFGRRYLYDMKYNHRCDYATLERTYLDSFGLCILCEKQLDFKDGRPPDLHHDHEDGEICGFTCHGCNLMIAGALEDKKVPYTHIRRYIEATQRSFLLDPDATKRRTKTFRNTTPNTTPDFDFSYIPNDPDILKALRTKKKGNKAQ